jgi:hypothetical protein
VEGGGEEEGSGEEEGGGAESFGGETNLEAELELGKEWGHAALPTAVYGNNPVGRGTKAHAVWQNVKYLNMHTAHGTTVDNKYTHVCVTRITAEQAGEDGEMRTTTANGASSAISSSYVKRAKHATKPLWPLRTSKGMANKPRRGRLSANGRSETTHRRAPSWRPRQLSKDSALEQL